MDRLFVDVILPLPLEGCFTYSVPPPLLQQQPLPLQVGSLVSVPLGAKRTYTALVVALHHNEPQGYAVKDIIGVLQGVPPLLPQQLTFWRWMADYYMCSVGDVLKAAMPPLVSSKSRTGRKPADAGNGDDFSDTGTVTLHSLSAPQQQALDNIKAALRVKNVCLLYGVTSSGKTEIYTHLMAETIKAGKQVLYLLPEIAMTTQIMQRLKNVFGSHIGIYHSKWPDAKRRELWLRQLSDNPYPIILGARSAVFLPYRNLGLVIVDEEHENTYKQQDPAPRYNARNAAIYLATTAGAKTLLGTATPSLESWYNATEGGKYALVKLTERYRGVQLPRVETVDIKELKRKKLMKGQFSPELTERIRTTLDDGAQVILFQNRRGYAPMLECHDCGWTPKCGRCDVSLTLHKRSGRLMCHYCGNTAGVPAACPNCGSTDIRQRGFGTEKIEDELHTLFPDARVARLDLDTSGSRTNYEKILHDFETQQTDILVGTQIISKGLDFGHVRTVGILNADNMLSYPDFRAYERAFQLMVQVSGRAGRTDGCGLVVLQTHDTENGMIDLVRRNDYEGMAATQLAERRLFRYPPYYRLVYVCLKHRYESIVDSAANAMAERMRAVLGSRVSEPMKPPVARVKSLFLRRIVIKVESGLPFAQVETALRQIKRDIETDSRFRNTTVYFDVDPQ